MKTPRNQSSPAEVAMEVTNLSATLGILTMPLFPFALPAILLVVVPVALVAVVLAIPVVPPILLALAIRKRRERADRGRRPRSRVVENYT